MNRSWRKAEIKSSSAFIPSPPLVWEAGVGLFFLLLYAFTLAPGLLPADAGEFQTTGAVLGVAHPPGFALYTLISWLVSRTPWVSPALAINGLSALLAALTLAAVSYAVRRWTGSPWAGLVAALALGFSTTFWAQATTANIRLPAAFAIALALAGLASPPAPSPLGRGGWGVRVTALALGLAVSHHGSTVFMAAVLGLYALSLVVSRPSGASGLGLREWAARLWPFALSLVPFLAWLYFPLRALFPGGEPRLATLPGFVEHILARGWAGDVLAFATPEALPDRLRVLGVLLQFQWNWILLVMAVMGAVGLVIGNRRLGLTLLAAFGLHAFIAITYRAPQTVEYLLPAYVLLAVFIGGAVGFIGPALKRVAAPMLRRAIQLVLAIVIAGGLAWQFIATFPAYRSLAGDDSTRAYAQAVLEDAPPGAAVLAAWHWATPLWYLQKVEGQRPDVEVIYVLPGAGTYGESWVAYIRDQLPSRPVVVTNYFKQEYAAIGFHFMPLGSAWRVQAEPIMDAPPGLNGGERFGEVEFLGFHLQSPISNLHVSSSGFSLLAAWRVTGAAQDINFFVHALGPDGVLYGQQDVGYPAARYVSGEVLLDRYSLMLLPEAPPGTYTLRAGAYRPDGTRLAEKTLTTFTLAPRAAAPITAHPQFRPFDGATLIGADVDHSLSDSERIYLHWLLGSQPARVSVYDSALDLPAGPGYLTTVIERPAAQPASVRYVSFDQQLILLDARLWPAAARPGDRITVELEFMAARPITQDLIIKIDLLGDGWRAQVDSVPVGGALPTLKWITGARIRDRFGLTIPAEAAPGSARLVLGWYDAFTQRDLPILDPRLAALGPTVPLGTVQIAR